MKGEQENFLVVIILLVLTPLDVSKYSRVVWELLGCDKRCFILCILAQVTVIMF